MKRNALIDVFKYIDMKGGNVNECWPWLGTLGSRDRDRPFFHSDGKKYIAYRLVYQLFTGVELSSDTPLRHKCDNSICCNPHHLEPGTQSQNEQDKYLRDRAGLPVMMVREIRRLLETTPYTQKQIAAVVSTRYGKEVSREAVRNIKLGLRRTAGTEVSMEEQVGKILGNLDIVGNDSEDVLDD